MKRRSSFRLVIAFFGIALYAITGHAEIRLPAIFSDHMVLQANERVPVWGWAKPNEKVSVQVDGQKLVTVADAQGRWRVRLEPMRAGRHLTMIVQGANKIVVEDVLTGEVWLGSGQSNMQMRVREAKNFPAEQTAADFPEIRMFTVALKASPVPLDDCQGTWKICNATNVGDFSASLYFFGRELHLTLQAPVGLIASSWGGTPIQPWIETAAMKAYPGYAALLERKQKEMAAWPQRQEQIEAQLETWKKAESEALANKQTPPPKPWNPGPPDSGQYMPSQLYQAMIHPLAGYGLRGMLWYQGEANAGGGAAGARDYTELLDTLITGWRAKWGRGNLPFYFVQLPNWRNTGDASQMSWAYFREGQAAALRVTNTAMAVTIDIGDADDIHPKNKQEAGRRLALLALANVYGRKVNCHGPVFAGCETNGTEFVIRFNHATGGLMARDGALKGFAVAGPDTKWHSAVARIERETVLVSSPEVSRPVAVRYGWANNPEVNLYNGAGLPAAPFRTDDW